MWLINFKWIPDVKSGSGSSVKFRVDDALHELERRVGVGASVVVLRGRADDVGGKFGSDRFCEFLRPGSVLGMSSRDLEAAEHWDGLGDLRDLRAEGGGWPPSNDLDVPFLEAVVRTTHAKLYKCTNLDKYWPEACGKILIFLLWCILEPIS